MIGVAAFNRSQLTPKLVQNDDAGAARKARRALCRNATIEASLGAVIIGIIAMLGTLPPCEPLASRNAKWRSPADACFQHIHSE